MMERIVYKTLISPLADCTNQPVMLLDETMQERYRNVKKRMEQMKLDILVVYADLEHGNNFEYLTGFLPRFEEALLVLHQSGANYMIMGNENLNKVPLARIKATAIHAPHFSLPNQPMDTKDTMYTILQKAKLTEGKRVGIAGWKKFTTSKEDNQTLFDAPSYIVDEIKHIVGETGKVTNAIDIFIGEKGARCTNNVNEIEHYEFGASLASDCMLKAMDQVDVGVSELQLGNILQAYGQKNSVVTIAAAGTRFVKANLYPTGNTVALKDPVSLTIGYKGGLSSRVGYAVEHATQLPQETQDYVDAVVKPYYGTVVSWLEYVHCGCKGNDIYQLIEQVLPKADYHWHLCPGHLTADEEWMCSPIYEGSEEILESGMLFQIDIIPSVSGYAGTSAETTVCLANEELQEKIMEQAPALWGRIQKRRDYLEQTLHIKIHPDILPMCSTVGYLRPFLLDKERAMAVE